MSQRSILSFFKSSEKTSVGKETEKKVVAVSDSPVKKPRAKRKVLCIESDEESSDIPKKKVNGESSKISEISNHKEDESSNKNCDKKENVDDTRNGDSSPRKPPKQMKHENTEEKTDLSPSPTEEKSDSSNHKENASSGSSDKVAEKEFSSNENVYENIIPKRKTARKQMNSGRNANRNVTQIKEKSDSETHDAQVESNIATSEERMEIKNEEKFESEVTDAVSSAVEKPENSEKTPENETFPDTAQKSPSIKNKASTAQKSPTFKNKTSTSKDKRSPEKKSAKIESLHSFFAPIRKTEDKISSGEDNKKSCSSQESENEESPVKKIKSRKKAQCIESDEEDAESVSKEKSIKKEAEDTKIEDSSTSSSLKTENKVRSPEKSPEDDKTSPKKPDAEKNKNDDKKKKLGVKSTSSVETVYDPSKSNYHPIDDAFWKRNEKVPYLALAKTLELIESISGRLKKIEILSNYFRSVIVLSPEDLLQSIYLCLNRVAPEYEGIEMGVGDTLLMKAVAQATGRTFEKVKAEVAIKGDLGLVSESSRGNQRVMFAPPKLTVSAVFNKFLEIAKMSGNASMAKKIDKIKSLFVACRDCEAKYIIRSLSGKLRINLAEQSVLSSIARAAVLTPPEQAYPPKIIDASKGKSSDSFKELLDSQILILKTAYCECPNYDLIVPVLLKEGISALPDRCQLSPGVPLKPMLAHPTAGIDKVLERFDKNAFTCEFKYDGERAQIHRNEKGEVKIFSRNQEDNTSKYPDVISRLKNALKESTKSFILDSEAVAWDTKTKQILPFQVLSTRKRKDAVESEIVVQVCVMAFDLLYLNGESLVKKSLKERRSLLHSSFNEVEDQIMFAQYRDGDNAETMQEFLDESVKGNCEGLMVKSLEVDASYEIAKRSHNWLKLKKDYLQGIGDTLDLVVIGGYYGKGKRTGNYGGFLLACYDEENEEFQSICKLGTGFKDDVLDAHTTFLKKQTIEGPKSYFRYDHTLEPDEWFEPIQVWEIKCADLSISPVHRAAIGIVDPEKGISLRFPRFIRIRDDKNPESATNSVQIADMYQKQQQIQNTTNKNSKIEEDYY